VSTVTTPESLTILALILGPVSAVQVQTFLERRRQKRERRIFTFKTLMATRGTGLSPDHVQALNMIDVEFYKERKFKKVISAWRDYFEHLVLPTPDDKPGLDRWGERRDDLLVELLYEMGESLKYDFDKAQIRRAVYTPKGHFEIEQEFNIIRKSLISVLTGKTPLPMDVRSFPDMEPTPEQQAANNLLMDLVERERQQRQLPPPANQ